MKMPKRQLINDNIPHGDVCRLPKTLHENNIIQNARTSDYYINPQFNSEKTVV
jgi:hypothetical protein